MNIQLRVMLFLGALFTLIYFMRQIQKNRLQIDYAIFWSLFSGSLLFMGLFPDVIFTAARILGFDSPANFVYLVIIFVLLFKLFTNTLKISKMNRQITEMAQHMGLEEKEALDRMPKEENTPHK